MISIMIQLLSALAVAAEEMAWGIDIEDAESLSDLHKSGQGIARLLQLMTCISSLDKLIRIRVIIIEEDNRND